MTATHAPMNAVLGVAAATLLSLTSGAIRGAELPVAGITVPNLHGVLATITVSGSVERDGNPFFLPLGTNGRSCASCHAPDDGWTSTPARLQRRFEDSQGTDPVFASDDAAVCQRLDRTKLPARREASRLLLEKGLVRFEFTPTGKAEFIVTEVDNPYGCSSKTALSVYRRIPMIANLPYLTVVMWDGRNTPQSAEAPLDLVRQATDAVAAHMSPVKQPTREQLEAVVRFESGLFSAQVQDALAGSLVTAGATGGPAGLVRRASQLALPSLSEAGSATQLLEQPATFAMYSAWESLPPTDELSRARASIARGERIFNTRPIVIRGVAGFSELGTQAELPHRVFINTCRTCHDVPGAGSHSVRRLFDTGVAARERRTPDMPLFTLRNRATGETVQTTDPGAALITGKWADVSRFKVPVLRGLAARAPYFHDGSASGLNEVVTFYDARFNLKLSEHERADLVAFLAAL